ncbi:MAG: hypothetical protein QME79_11990 [Bacillota bacterium]|nr:hypothetical protein [Bacillota bacterium]
MRFREGAVYCAEPLLRDLKRYLTAEVFLSRYYGGRHTAFLYLDRLGHPHVRFAEYDFTPLAGLAAFLEVCREVENGETDPQRIRARIGACPEARSFRQLVDAAFVEHCLRLVRRHGLPYQGVRGRLEQRLNSILPRVGYLRERASAFKASDGQHRKHRGRDARPISGGFSIGSRPCAKQLVTLWRQLQGVG